MSGEFEPLGLTFPGTVSSEKSCEANGKILRSVVDNISILCC